MIWLIALAAALAAGAAWWWWQRARLRALRWPANLTFLDFTRRIARFLRLHGWTVRPVESADYQFIAKRGREEFGIRCAPSGIVTFRHVASDLRRANAVGARNVLFITAEHAPADIVRDAREKGVFLLHYSHLGRLCAGGDNRAGDNKADDNQADDNKAGDNKAGDNKAGDITTATVCALLDDIAPPPPPPAPQAAGHWLTGAAALQDLVPAAESRNLIINLHRTKTNNVGDLKCAPVQYFDFLQHVQELDLLGFKQSETPLTEDRRAWLDTVSAADTIIIGGGGLLGIDFFEPGLKKLFEIKKPEARTVLWGAGHNEWVIGDWRKLKFELNLSPYAFDLVGIRDYNQGLAWVPCVSCMSPLFDQHRAITPSREVGLYVHRGTLLNESFQQRLPTDLDILSNDATFEEAVAYLASCDLVLTDSYHGAYWATLLGKRVVAFPSSSKFYDLRHAVPLCAPGDWQRFAVLARAYPEALDECRAANVAFAENVKSII